MLRDQIQFYSSIAKVFLRNLNIYSYIQIDGTWLIFSAIFKVFLCFVRLLPNPFNGFLCHFLVFPLLWGAPSAIIIDKIIISIFFPLQKNIIYDFIVLRWPSPISFVYCHNFLRNLSMSLYTNKWRMTYFPCNFQGFPLFWAASAKSLKKLQFSSFQWFFLPFSNFFCALGCSIPGQLLINL